VQKIVCKLKRKNGTVVELGKGSKRVVYHFKPTSGFDKDGSPVDMNDPHVCEIKDEHVQTFLAIKEAYCLEGQEHVADEEEEAAVPPAATTTADGNLVPVIEMIDEDDDADEDDDTTPDADADDEPPAMPDLSGVDNDTLRKMVEEKTGKTPAKNASRDKLVAVLQAAA